MLPLGEDLVQIGAQHVGRGQGEMDTGQQRGRSWHVGGGMQDKGACFGQNIIGFGDAEVAEGEFGFGGVFGDEFHAEGAQNLFNAEFFDQRGVPEGRFTDFLGFDQCCEFGGNFSGGNTSARAGELLQLCEEERDFGVHCFGLPRDIDSGTQADRRAIRSAEGTTNIFEYGIGHFVPSFRDFHHPLNFAEKAGKGRIFVQRLRG